jgi:phage FluMu gp28-like protein
MTLPPNFEEFKKQLKDPAAFEQPVMAREPDGLPVELTRGADIPADLDPLADGILMLHQKEWIEDDSPLKLGEKGRRTGITFAEALDETTVAASARSAGGENCFYIGDTKDKGREFIGYVAHFARTIAGELGTIEEFVFTDQVTDETTGEVRTNQIAAFRVNFASGFRVEALSSRPENIRGLQGRVCIDEAAFHKDVRAVLDAVNALLIWGGKIRIISTHNGVLNPFNELIAEAKAGKIPYSLHFIPFSKAVANGLYERTCYVKGVEPTDEGKAAWLKLIYDSYGIRTAARDQELECIPSDAQGAALTRVLIEACMALPGQVPIVRWTLPDSFKDLDKPLRESTTRDWCEATLRPILDKLRRDRPHFYGQDFARSGDASSILIGAQERTLTLSSELLVELRNVPFETQRDVLFYIVEKLPRFSGGAGDATGNGAYLAEVARQKFGERVVEVKFSTEWYRVNSIPYVEAFGDRTILLPRHEDVLRDHQSLAYVNGVVMVPSDMRFKGSDGLDRHGDSAIAGMLLWFASRQGAAEYAYRGAPNSSGQAAPGRMSTQPPDDDNDRGDRGWWSSPIGTEKFGGF